MMTPTGPHLTKGGLYVSEQWSTNGRKLFKVLSIDPARGRVKVVLLRAKSRRWTLPQWWDADALLAMKPGRPVATVDGDLVAIAGLADREEDAARAAARRVRP